MTDAYFVWMDELSQTFVQRLFSSTGIKTGTMHACKAVSRIARPIAILELRLSFIVYSVALYQKDLCDCLSFFALVCE